MAPKEIDYLALAAIVFDMLPRWAAGYPPERFPLTKGTTTVNRTAPERAKGSLRPVEPRLPQPPNRRSNYFFS